MKNSDSHFHTHGYQIVEDAVSKETASILSTDFTLFRDLIARNNQQDLGSTSYSDKMIERCFAWYAHTPFEALLLHLQPKVEEIVEEKLYPCYSYARIYYNGALMSKHTDRRSCEYSVTLTLEVDKTPWGIWFTDLHNNTKELMLDVGSMCVYQGNNLPHWREFYEGTKQIQVFLHYVKQDGPYAHCKFDGRPILGENLRTSILTEKDFV
jgi:hypothetical protein